MSNETWTKPGPAMCESDSLIARSIPIRSMSLIVYALIPSSRIRSRSRASTERSPTSATRAGSTAGSVQASLSKRPSAKPSAAASGIPWTLPLGDVSGVFMSRVRVDPEHAADAVGPREAAERADRDRVVAAEDERQGALLERQADESRHAVARGLDLGQVPRRASASSVASGTGLHVAPVEHLAAEAAKTLLDACVPDRGGTHVDAAASGAEVECGADHRDPRACTHDAT